MASGTPRRVGKDRAGEVIGRLDEAAGALGEAREVCEEIGEAAEEEMHDCSMAMGIVEEVAAAIEANAEGGPFPGPGGAEGRSAGAASEDPWMGWPLWRRRLLEAGARKDLVLAFSFGGGYARFYDAAERFGGPSEAAEEAEILYWDQAEFDEEPGLLGDVLQQAAEHRARVVHESAYGRAAHPEGT